MAYQYKRRRPSIIRNFWVYRRLIGTAVLLGLMLWFIWANDAAVTVAFPFRLGTYQSTVGVIILLSALCGSILTILGMTVFFALRKMRGSHGTSGPVETTEDVDDRPPPDYASKTKEGFPDSGW
ncbi:DUF1049 domain-containing protein [Paludisphaera soli]|uniref:DUF1049 domain-containing protein n=1 Tax=Paludisphaera soli TaxID=2712865 RepID=UPI0013ECFEA9|nr:DUF1049 domain-containing protein [Paludisphaera soli]